MDYRDLLDAAVIGTQKKPVEVHAEPTADDFFLAHLYNEMLSIKKQNEELIAAIKMLNDVNLMKSYIPTYIPQPLPAYKDMYPFYTTSNSITTLTTGELPKG